jgi:hypothetical protein
MTRRFLNCAQGVTVTHVTRRHSTLWVCYVFATLRLDLPHKRLVIYMAQPKSRIVNDAAKTTYTEDTDL